MERVLYSRGIEQVATLVRTTYKGTVEEIGIDNLKKYQIFYCDLGQAVEGDSTQAGLRPCILVSNDKNNRHSPTINIIPITSRAKKKMPTHCRVMCGTESVAMAEQIRTISKKRICTDEGIVNKVYEIPHCFRGEIDRILRVQLGL